MKQILFRHGDVYFIANGNKDAKATKKADEPIVAYGEKTMHRHRFNSGATVLVRPETPMLGRVVEIEAPTEITHEEHRPIPFEPGIYEVRHQRVYSDVGIHRVLD